MKWDHMRLKLKRRGHALNDFRYACAGCSVYMSRNKGSVDRGGDSPELPGCAGIQVKFCTCPFLDGGLVQVVWCLLDLKNGLVTVINGNHEILVQVEQGLSACRLPSN